MYDRTYYILHMMTILDKKIATHKQGLSYLIKSNSIDSTVSCLITFGVLRPLYCAMQYCTVNYMYDRTYYILHMMTISDKKIATHKQGLSYLIKSNSIDSTVSCLITFGVLNITLSPTFLFIIACAIGALIDSSPLLTFASCLPTNL